jgi:polo-like kinase 1
MFKNKQMIPSNKKKDMAKPIPETVINPTTQTVYRRGQYLGKGGFARCYELIDKSKSVFAGKAVAKSALLKPSNKEKMAQEISIHKALSHKHIVQLFSYFEDNDYIYLILELCENRSLMELQKRRNYVTEPEARYFMYQIVYAVQYLHERLIIHRDLKLGNIFINGNMQLKVGDFGLATQLTHRDERKDTLCGTPNYIAPEMLQRKKHSFEVDIWACGCILYTFICGRPPFETSSLQETYSRIKHCAFEFPSVVGYHASELITQLLHPDPSKRPRAMDILNFKFFVSGFTPKDLPKSCLTNTPKIDHRQLCGGQMDSQLLATAVKENKANVFAIPKGPAGDALRQPAFANNDLESIIVRERQGDADQPKNLAILLDEQLTSLLNSVSENVDYAKSIDILGTTPDIEAESPSLQPVYYVTKWVDYSDKYGLGYQLADGSVGVIFNDSSRLMIDRELKNITYTERNGVEKYFTSKTAPANMHKKMTLLKYFIEYMKEQLLQAANHKPEPGSDLSCPSILNNWFRSKVAIVLALSNGTVQLNFFDERLKIILCPKVQACTLIGEDRLLHTYSFESLAQHGCSKSLFSRLRYAKTTLERLISRLGNDKK